MSRYGTAITIRKPVLSTSSSLTWGVTLLFAYRYPGVLHALVTQHVTTPVKVAPASPFDCPVYRVVTSFAAKTTAVIRSQWIHFAHPFFSSCKTQSAVFITVGRGGFEIDQIFLKFITFNCSWFSLKGTYFAAVSIAHTNQCGVVVFLPENGSHFAELGHSLPASHHAAGTGNSQTFTLGLHAVEDGLKMMQ